MTRFVDHRLKAIPVMDPALQKPCTVLAWVLIDGEHATMAPLGTCAMKPMTAVNQTLSVTGSAALEKPVMRVQLTISAQLRSHVGFDL